ncbi:MAG TPA: GNAT family N-acetyltransferase [Saprospiraceae bacterium]|nr:GNAT family N-acetyltransferase [Saprospiraceae bacterium]
MSLDLNLKRTDSSNPDFTRLVRELDLDLAVKDGDEHSFYDQFNHIDTIKYVIVAFENNIAVSCGAIKEFSPEAMEVKRMYTIPERRGYGIAAAVLKELEKWAAEMGYHKCVLETGKRQPDAIRLYEKNGYSVISNYGQYAGRENSVCFEKVIRIL